jgi:hypothetical protein
LSATLLPQKMEVDRIEDDLRARAVPAHGLDIASGLGYAHQHDHIEVTAPCAQEALDRGFERVVETLDASGLEILCGSAGMQ